MDETNFVNLHLWENVSNIKYEGKNKRWN